MLKSLPVQNFLTLPQAAKQLHVSDQTLRNWTDAGRIDAYLTEGDHRRYLEQDVRLLQLAERSRNEGEDKPYLLCSGTAVRREGDEFFVVWYDEDKDEEINLPFDEYEQAIDPYKGKLRFNSIAEYKNKNRLNWQALQELRFLETGQSQEFIGTMEFQTVFGSITGVAYAEQSVQIVAGTEQEAKDGIIKLIHQAKANLLKNAIPVYGICSYQTAEGQDLPTVKI